MSASQILGVYSVIASRCIILVKVVGDMDFTLSIWGVGSVVCEA